MLRNCRPYVTAIKVIRVNTVTATVSRSVLTNDTEQGAHAIRCVHPFSRNRIATATITALATLSLASPRHQR